MAELKRFSLVKPTLQTKYHIDFNWWSQNDRDWRIDLYGFLCPEHQQLYADLGGEEVVDWVDPETAEVQRVDGLQHVLITHCAKQPDFLNDRRTMVEGVFCVLLANGNTPMTPVELAELLGKSPTTILQTFSGVRVYKGIRPCPGC